VRRAAKTAAAEDPAPLPPPRQAGELGLDEGRHRREAVGDVVDEDIDLEAVDRFERAHRG
jgi:hypothetical protein